MRLVTCVESRKDRDNAIMMSCTSTAESAVGRNATVAGSTVSNKFTLSSCWAWTKTKDSLSPSGANPVDRLAVRGVEGFENGRRKVFRQIKVSLLKGDERLLSGGK